MKIINDTSEKTLTVDCDCSNIEHVIRFTYYSDDDDRVYIYQSLNADIPFFTRLKNAFKYLFRVHPYDAMFGETLLAPHDVRDLLQFLQKYNDHAERAGLYRIQNDD